MASIVFAACGGSDVGAPTVTPAPTGTAAERTIRQSLERIRINIAWLERNRAELAAHFQPSP